MKNYSIGRLFGVEIQINLLLLIFLGFYLLTGGLAPFLVISLLFLCVLMHEFGHVFAARGFGIKCFGIILTPLGGIALLDLPRTAKTYRPFQEFVIAFAGPLVTLATVFALFPFIRSYPILAQLYKFNIILFVFNLLPIFPMDGGRIFKSIVAMFLNHRKAGRTAGAVGMVLGVAMTAYFISNLMFMGMLIGGFMTLSAYAEFKENKK